jgi:hypothetical protein
MGSHKNTHQRGKNNRQPPPKPKESIANGAKEKITGSEWWTKLDISSKLISGLVGLVVASIGILFAWYGSQSQILNSQSIAQSQIEAQKIQAENDEKLEEGRLTAQLLEYLTGKDPKQREIAIKTLEKTVPPDVYQGVIEVLAKSDPDENVRKAAIEQLGKTNSFRVDEALLNLDSDKKLTQAESKVAHQSVQRAAIGTVLTSDTYVFAASDGVAIEKYGNGLFTHFLLKGLNGEADVNSDDSITANELMRFLSSEMSKESGARKSDGVATEDESEEILRELNSKSGSAIDLFTQYSSQNNPVSAFDGSGNTPIWGRKAPYKRLVALTIAVNQYSDTGMPRLAFSLNDAADFEKILKKDKRALSKLLINPRKTDVTAAMDELKSRLEPEDLLIVYFSGHGVMGTDGIPKWGVTDTKRNDESTLLSLTMIKTFFDQVQVKTKTLYIDACFQKIEGLFGNK